MTAVETQNPRGQVRDDLSKQIHGVALEVEEVRTEMGGLETRLVDRMADLETRMVDRMADLESRMVDRMLEMERKLSDRFEGEIDKLRHEMANFQRSLRGWLALGVSLMAVLVTLAAFLG